jgi:hypothetical protein
VIEEAENQTTTTTPTATPTSPSPSPNQAPPSIRAARRADPTAGLVEAGERMRLGLLATTAPGSALDDALTRSLIPAVSITRADGPVGSNSDLTLHSSGPVDPSARRGDLGSIGVTRKDSNDHVAVKDTPGPEYSIDVRPVLGPVPVSNAERVIAGLRPAFRRCYEQGLDKDPSMSGDVTVRARVRATGEVDSTTVMSQNGLSPGVTACIRRKIETAEFDKPAGSNATIDIPVKFVRQR